VGEDIASARTAVADTRELPDAASESSSPGLVPPPVASEIDALLDAVSAGRSPVRKSVGESRMLSATSPAARGSSAFRVWQPAIVRGVAPSVAAFLVGVVGALWGLRALPPTSPALLENVVTTAESPRSEPSPVAVPSEPVPQNLQPLPPTALVRETVPAAAQQVPEIQRSLPTATAGTALASAAQARPRSAGTLAPAPIIATPATEFQHLIEAPAVRESPVLLSSAPPDLSPAPADHAIVAQPVRVANELTPAAPEVDAAAEEEHAVRQTLLSYEEAYEELDVTAAADVWPSVDRRALSRAFATLKSQGLDFESCAITVRDSQATVACHGTLQVVRKVGNAVPLKADQHWLFKMRRLAGMWKIDEVSTSRAPVMAMHRIRGEG
jgi:hypothetical protein